MKIKNLFLLLSFAMGIGSTAFAQDFEYIGAAKCKMCHNKATTGTQYDIWAKSLHANALASLSSEKSLTYAKANGIADPTKEAKCLKCHSTYHSVNSDLIATLTDKEGVSCESCHGPGSVYKSMSIMKDQAQALKNGLVLPTKEVCLNCHNEKNPFHKPFDFNVAVKKIAHPNPAAAK